jgi:hypothetical protein
MRVPVRLVLLLSCAFVGSLSGTTVLTCGVNGAPLSGSGCYSLANFSFSDTIDWQNTFGTADQNAHNVTTSGIWQGVTDGGVQVGATFGPTYSGVKNILLQDNFKLVFDGTTWVLPFTGPYANYFGYAGTFNAPPNPDAGTPGDHLLTTPGGSGALELQFGTAIQGALFRISTPTSGDVNATVAAYSVINPTSADVPLMTYTINAHATLGTNNPAGTCDALGLVPPIPCNNAPYIGIDTGLLNIRSLVISTPDNGLFIDGVFLDEAPEPGTFALTGVVGILAFLGRRRMLRTRQS